MKIDSLVVLLALLLCSACEAKRTTVTITNTLDPKVTMMVHCKSGNDDLGPQFLLPGQTWGFSFKINAWPPIIFGKTLFFCRFNWAGTGDKWFNIYEQGNDATSDCTDCKWIIHSDGPCGFSTVQNKYVCFPWK